MNLLSDCGLLGGLEKYSGNVLRKRSSNPKFQVFNNALLTAQDNKRFSEVVVNAKEWGRLVESAIGTHLINNSISERYNLYYWREVNEEVDFILEKNGKLVALEVKSGQKSDNTDPAVFSKKYNPARLLLVGTGGIPYDEFLKINPKKLF